jgi:HAMP domain-containing protein
MAFVITATVVLFRYFRVQRNTSPTEKLREEFDKGKDALLAAAMAKKQAAEAAESGERELSADEQERESLRESVDPQRVIGQNCAICGLELMADEELVIDPYTGTGYHLSSFLNDWPLDPDTHQPLPRPKFVYRYPDGTVVHSSELVYTF